MKILLTGGSGFLGKRVLDLLVASPEVEAIEVIARHKLSHPSRKVRTRNFDLTHPAVIGNLEVDADAVVHIAGLYSVMGDFNANYLHNVLITTNLLHCLQAAGRPVPLHYVSTHMVGSLDDARVLEETPIERVPNAHLPYAHCKAIAEQAVLRSGLPGSILRLGVLVGDSQGGTIEKCDGVYHFMRAFWRLGRSRAARLMRFVPVPARPDGIVPLVPVDCAAQVVARAALMPAEGKQPAIYGVYRCDSVSIDTLCRAILARYLPTARPQ
jgi:nucleoside-diphosphate-sugar epimerase